MKRWRACESCGVAVKGEPGVLCPRCKARAQMAGERAERQAIAALGARIASGETHLLPEWERRARAADRKLLDRVAQSTQEEEEEG